MTKVVTREAKLRKILGEPTMTKGSQLFWACPYCKSEGGDPDDDDFVFNNENGKYSCFANSDHTKLVSKRMRELFMSKNMVRLKKRNDVVPEDIPQEIYDLYLERMITPEALDYFKVKWDASNLALMIPTKQMKYKFKPLHGQEFWETGTDLNNNTLYEASKYKYQKNFLYVEGIPDIWAIKSNFPQEFFDDWYVCATTHGASHIPEAWNIKGYFDKFQKIILCGDNDEAGKKGVGKLKTLIGSKAQALELPFKNKRVIFGEELEVVGKDFNDWLLEGNKYTDFEKFIDTYNEYDEKLDKAIAEIENSPNRLQLMIDDVHRLGVIEEDMIIAVVFLACLSYKFDTCLGVVLKGRFSSGKSVIVKTVVKLFPPERILSIASFSKQALQYMTDLSHKIIFQTEEPPADDPAYWELYSSLRQLISEGEITRAVVEKNLKTNKMETILQRVTGPAPYISTTTQRAIHEENESRLIALQTCDTPIHITKVKDMLDKKAMGLWITKKEQDFIIAKWRKYIDRLPMWEMEDIKVPFSDQLDMQVYGSDMIRDYDKLLKMLKILAFFEFRCDTGGVRHTHDISATNTPILEYKQELTAKEGKYGGATLNSGRETPYIQTSLENYNTIYHLTKDFFNSKATKISQSVFQYFERTKKAMQGLPFTAVKISEVLILGKRQAQRLIREWLEEGMITREGENAEHNRHQYKINQDWEVIEAELTPPEQILSKEGIDGIRAKIQHKGEIQKQEAIIEGEPTKERESSLPDRAGDGIGTSPRSVEIPIEPRSGQLSLLPESRGELTKEAGQVQTLPYADGSRADRNGNGKLFKAPQKAPSVDINKLGDDI